VVWCPTNCQAKWENQPRLFDAPSRERPGMGFIGHRALRPERRPHLIAMRVPGGMMK
jgi:hypothetical protein